MGIVDEDTEFERIAMLEAYKAALEAGRLANKSAMIINGGGAVALLAFIGRIFDPITNAHIPLVLPMILFCAGALFVAISHGFVYLFQYCNAVGWDKKGVKAVLNRISIILVIVSYLAFGFGCWFSAIGVGW